MSPNRMPMFPVNLSSGSSTSQTGKCIPVMKPRRREIILWVLSCGGCRSSWRCHHLNRQRCACAPLFSINCPSMQKYTISIQVSRSSILCMPLHFLTNAGRRSNVACTVRLDKHAYGVPIGCEHRDRAHPTHAGRSRTRSGSRGGLLLLHPPGHQRRPPRA